MIEDGDSSQKTGNGHTVKNMCQKTWHLVVANLFDTFCIKIDSKSVKILEKDTLSIEGQFELVTQ